MTLQPYIIDHLAHDGTVTQSFVPENLGWTMNDMDESTITYEISKESLDLDGDPVITGDDFISPKNTGWQLRYGANDPFFAGVHTNVEMEYGRPYMSVAGSDWMWYFNQRFMPFDGRVDHAHDYVIGTPAEGASIEVVSADVATVLTDILDMVLGRPNSMPITYSLSATGVEVDYYRLDLADDTTLLAIFQALCAYTPGVVFEITPGQVFQIATPRWYGDPNAIAGDDTNANLIWVFHSPDFLPQSLGFTNTGPAATHEMGQGSGTTTTYVDSRGNTANQEVYYRLDKSATYDDAMTRASVVAYNHDQFALDLNPVHEIPITVDPHQIDIQNGMDDGFFWTVFKPGRAFYIDLELIAHHIDSAHHIVQMDCSVNANGVCLVNLTQNQIYDTSGDAYVLEG